ncbi:MAG: hypothetical protein KME18_07870 [Phormidium tanganyikae FI6-MK23]|jgi:hypothetical protein|nr:hypothetical protein [Phormidium tanganyikae FI6-MK23]
MSKQKEEVAAVESHPEPQEPIATGNYVGKLKTSAGEVEFELRQPTLDDMPRLEELLSARGFDLSAMSELPRSEQVYLLFTLLCIRFGEESSCSRATLGKLPMSAFKEVSEAVSNFREFFGA